MTSEVCLMNRLAVVLAADSATTVTRWTDNGKEERYFKGANKIFQLSSYHPVGLMIFDAAEIMKVPWEVVVKDFRASLGNKSFNDLDGYAGEFFAFLDASARLFPANIQREAFLSASRSASLRVIFQTAKTEGATDDARRADLDIAVEQARKVIDAREFPEGLDEGFANQTITSWRDDLVEMIKDWRGQLDEVLPTDMESLAELGILAVFKNPFELLGATGLVFAGFGDHDVFPGMIEFSSAGMVAGKHISKRVSSMAIDHDTPAWLRAFAQTSMSDTFSSGISEDVYNSMMQAITAGLATFAEAICKQAEGDLTKVPDIQVEITKARQAIGESVFETARREHAFPLRRVLGVLPIDEMADLAETLIKLQSLKEKLTKPSETVSGPIDVAVITRSEGLVWIKRKHFFDAALNSRYLQRQAALYG